MERRMINTLILGDQDLECKCEDLKIEDLTISHLGFKLGDLEKFDMIVYTGNKGQKIIKSKYTKTGKID